MGTKNKAAEKKESLKDLVLKLEKENKIVIMTFDGAMSGDLDEMIDSQPLDGLLYDLNRDRVTILSWIDDPEYGQKWVNDFASCLVISRLHERNIQKDKQIKELENKIKALQT